MNISDKLLSHRFRGFTEHEHTFEGFQAAALSSVKYFELDTRVSKDSVLLVYHDPCYGGVPVCDRNSDEMPETPKLKDALVFFKEHFAEDTVFCLDVKDIGVEKEHLELIESSGLAGRIVIVSWCAAALMNFRKLGFLGQMFLSHESLFSSGILRKISEHSLKNRLRKNGRILRTGKQIFEEIPEHLHRGYEHSLVCRTLPDKLLDTLKSSGGGVCVRKDLLCGELENYCAKNGLKLWIYSVNDVSSFRKYAETSADKIFSDDAGRIMKDLTAGNR